MMMRHGFVYVAAAVLGWPDSPVPRGRPIKLSKSTWDDRTAAVIENNKVIKRKAETDPVGVSRLVG